MEKCNKSWRISHCQSRIYICMYLQAGLINLTFKKIIRMWSDRPFNLNPAESMQVKRLSGLWGGCKVLLSNKFLCAVNSFIMRVLFSIARILVVVVCIYYSCELFHSVANGNKCLKCLMCAKIYGKSYYKECKGMFMQKNGNEK